jgi:hypothetical protein
MSFTFCNYLFGFLVKIKNKSLENQGFCFCGGDRNRTGVQT